MSDWLTAAIKKIEDMPQQAKDVRQAAMDDLFTFARLINPQRVYGEIHKDDVGASSKKECSVCAN